MTPLMPLDGTPLTGFLMSLRNSIFARCEWRDSDLVSFIHNACFFL